ncbi:MFS transporter [Streptomyces dioscori]|uniref:MFS transporter n=1 Tax=Streptomyces dioscori TaxID=2109333 RepID=A0A2P8PYI6_9ACTN|nr:MFS transporter [Streptomyces dioscori]PSM39062.1 MFS transporter [Streptomyces dioscori]
MASYVDASTIVSTGIALVLYQQSIGVTPNQIGILSGVLTLGIGLGALLGGRLGDRFGRRNVFMVTMALIAAGIAFLVFGTSFYLLLAGIVLAGFGTGADLPVSLATISEAATDKNRGAMIGLSAVLWSVGVLVSVTLAIFAGGWGHLGGQVLFGQIGVVTLIVLICRVGIPESQMWSEARERRLGGARTIRADKVRARDLLKAPYFVPFAVLLVFYALTNAASNTNGQFGTYLAVNVAHISVQMNSLIGFLTLPIYIVLGLVFMRIVDSKNRMLYFTVGSVSLILAYAVPAAFGFTVTTIIIMNVLSAIGGAFAFEGILKVWAQESFPTLLRSSAQGAIFAVGRMAAAGLAFFTPAIAAASFQGLYWGLTVIVAIGLTAAWVTFRRVERTQFTMEQELDPEIESPRDVPGTAVL